MNRITKIITKMRTNPRDWRIEDLTIIADRYGIAYRPPGTSHVTFRFPSGNKLTVPAHKPIKPVYIKQFILLLTDGGFIDE